ncbi:MAG: hydroxyacid dehydrogenase [Thermodesulfobacteriota bacterium]
MPALTREGQKVLMTAVLPFDASKTVMEDAAIKITVDDLLHISAEEAVLGVKSLVVDLLKLLEVILDTLVILGVLRFPGAVCGRSVGHRMSCPSKGEYPTRIMVRNTKISRQILEAAPRLRVIGRHGVGYNTIDTAAATEMNIRVVYTPAANTESVAEIAMGFIICLGRKLVQAHTAMQSGQLISDRFTLSVMSQKAGLANADLRGKTLGVIGVGLIGSSLSRKAIAAFQMRVLGYDPYVDASTLAGYGVEKVEKLEDMLPQCDFVTLHCPGGAETRHMMNEHTISPMKPGAYLLNTARGTVIHEAALIQALQGGRIGGAAMDVFDPEPPRSDNPLLHMENVLVTPHYSAMTEESLYNMATMVAQGVLDGLNGKRPQYLVNPEIWERRRLPPKA